MGRIPPFLSLSTLLFAVTVAWADPSVPAYELSVVSPMVKVRGDESGPVNPGRTLVLNAARGEGESGQILIQASTDLDAVAVTATPLTGPRGSVVPFELRRVGCVPVTNPAPGGFGRPGPYPDPLLPLRPFALKAGGSQALWATAWVPRDVPAGDYRGSITIAPEGAAATSLAVTLRVAPVTLPVRSALRTSFLIWGFGGNREWYGREDWNRRQRRFAQTLLRYRFSVPPDLPWSAVFARGAGGEWTARWTEFDRTVEERLAEGITWFEIRRHLFPWSGGTPLSVIPDADATAAKLRLLGTHLDERGWADRFAFYLFDEPLISDDYPKPGDRRGSTNATNIMALARLIHAHAPNLRLMMVTCDPAHETVALDVPAYVWCPHINHYHPDFQARRRTMGEPNWMYVCVTTVHAPAYPDIWRIDRTGTSHRAVGSWLWRYRCDGFLYWAVDYWKKNPYETPDIFPMAGSNGDGFLFYPDPERQADPFPSIRAELTRDGFEDYELLTLLESAVRTIGAEPGRRQAVKPLLAEAERLLDLSDTIPAVAVFAQEPDVYEARHRRILELLERLGHALTGLNAEVTGE